MQLVQIGVFAWQFALAILPASAWLIVCHLIPALRRRVNTSYCIALLIAALSCVFTHYDLFSIRLPAGALVLIILVTRWHQALKHRSLEANTIISFHHHDDR
jgi:hypothetical protein